MALLIEIEKTWKIWTDELRFVAAAMKRRFVGRYEIVAAALN